jgi:hypothetical protein
MWEGYKDDHFDVSALIRLQSEIEKLAKACSIEVRLVGGLLKFTPIGVYTKVLLELEQPNFKSFPVIYQHRTPELTSLYKGKAVSRRWVAGFLKHNASEARKFVSEQQMEIAKRQNEEKDTQRKMAETSRTRPKRVRCKACGGEGRWRAGDPRDGDARFEYCS